MTSPAPSGLARDDWLSWAHTVQLERNGTAGLPPMDVEALWDTARRSAALDIVLLLRSGTTDPQQTPGLTRAVQLVTDSYGLTVEQPAAVHLIRVGMTPSLRGMWSCTCGLSREDFVSRAATEADAETHRAATGGRYE